MIDERIHNLKVDLYNIHLDEQSIFQKHMLDIQTYLNTIYDKNIEIKLKNIISSYLCVPHSEIQIVGSSKLGYSLNPKKIYQKFDERFTNSNQKKDKSDIDIAVISTSLFNHLKEDLYNFTDGLNVEWDENEYYKKGKFSPSLNYKLYQYAFKGWFRPDFRPIGYELCRNDIFENLKKDIYQLTKRKLGLAIYENQFFFTNYHLKNLHNLRLELRTGLL